MMRIERTRNANRIRAIVCEPQVMREMGAEECPAIPLRDDFYHLIGQENGTVGIVSFFPNEDGTYSPHMAVLPAHRGSGTELLRLGLGWFKEKVSAPIRAEAPASNPRMIRVFEKCGLKVEVTCPG